MRMRIGIAIFALAFASTSAFAQQQKFVPFTVDEAAARNLRAYLDEQPMKTGLPILQWMDGLETKALKDIADKAAAEARPEATPPKKK
jgi:hypothetical protein